MNQISQQAFILRILPSKINRVSEALANDQIIIGWANAEGLLNEGLDWEAFRKIISDAYYASEKNLRKGRFRCWQHVAIHKGDEYWRYCCSS